MLWQIHLVYSFLTSQSWQSQGTWETRNVSTVPLPNAVSLNLLAWITKSWLGRLGSLPISLPGVGKPQSRDSPLPNLMRSLPRYQPLFLWLIPPRTLCRGSDPSVMVLATICSGSEKYIIKSMSIHHRLKCSTSFYVSSKVDALYPLYHIRSSALRMSAMMKLINTVTNIMP